MTRDEIMAMEPGRELDALVAEKIMGETVYPDYGVINNHGVKPYSTDIAEAWQVVEEMLADDWDFVLCSDFTRWTAVFVRRKEDCSAIGETAPWVICKAALLTCGEVTG